MSAIQLILTLPSELSSELVCDIIMMYSYHGVLIFIVKHHNLSCPDQLIRSVLCPGLGTAVGRMPVLRCAIQMRVAYEAVIFGNVEAINQPQGLSDCCSHHVFLYKV